MIQSAGVERHLVTEPGRSISSMDPILLHLWHQFAHSHLGDCYKMYKWTISAVMLDGKIFSTDGENPG